MSRTTTLPIASVEAVLAAIDYIRPGSRWPGTAAAVELRRRDLGLAVDQAAYGISWAIETGRLDWRIAQPLEALDAPGRAALIVEVAERCPATGDVPAYLIQRFVAAQEAPASRPVYTLDEASAPHPEPVETDGTTRCAGSPTPCYQCPTCGRHVSSLVPIHDGNPGEEQWVHSWACVSCIEPVAYDTDDGAPF